MTYKALLPALAILLTISQVAQSQTLTLTGTLRDMPRDGQDFEGQLGVDPGIVQTTLGPNRKPQYNGNPTTITTTGATNFERWYNDITDVTTIDLILTDTDGNGVYTYENNNFFPMDEGRDPSGTGADGKEHNFHFTMEIHAEFTYLAALNQVFSFSGDDDVWVFINGILVIDLGGVHTTLHGSVTLNDVAGDLGLVNEGTYNFDFFFAERHTVESNFKIETSIELIITPPCDPKCVWQPKFCERTDVKKPAVLRSNRPTISTA